MAAPGGAHGRRRIARRARPAGPGGGDGRQLGLPVGSSAKGSELRAGGRASPPASAAMPPEVFRDEVHWRSGIVETLQTRLYALLCHLLQVILPWQGLALDNLQRPLNPRESAGCPEEVTDAASRIFLMRSPFKPLSIMRQYLV
ncbi:unnamed protein product [Coccothraustes coccothraustes]